jgi:hypothetical protein
MNSLTESKTSREIERVFTPDTIKSSETLKPIRISKLKRQASGFARQRETIIHIRPWYLQPQLADQIEEDAKGYIRNASFAALVERLTTHDAPVNSTGTPRRLMYPLTAVAHRDIMQDNQNLTRSLKSSYQHSELSPPLITFLKRWPNGTTQDHPKAFRNRSMQIGRKAGKHLLEDES